MLIRMPAAISSRSTMPKLLTAILIPVLAGMWSTTMWAESPARLEWKLDRPPTFADFPVTGRFEGKNAEVDLASHPKAKLFRTRLRVAATEDADFAGYYKIAMWGCGTQCQGSMAVDLRTGRVVDGFMADRGLAYTIESRLVIADPACSGTCNVSLSAISLPVRYYILEANEFRLIYELPCKVTDLEKLEQACGTPQ